MKSFRIFLVSLWSFSYGCLGQLHKENVALTGTCSMSEKFSNTGDCTEVIDNDTDLNLRFANDGSPNCMHTTDSYPAGCTPFWQLVLNQDYTITNITIYNRAGYPHRLKYTDITVDGSICKSFGSDVSIVQNDTDTFQCSSPIRGRTVNISRHSTCSNNGDFTLNLCEVQVWVCSRGWYGNDCNSPCSGHCSNNATCDRYNGSCLQGCQSGYHGSGCNSRCPQNCDGGCNQSSGDCFGCISTYWGSHCDTKCGNCYPGTTCDKVNGNCTCTSGFKPLLCSEACDNGTFGLNCSFTCGNCLNGTPCNKVNGTCPACKPGWQPPLCQQACANGTYGNCSIPCGHCMNNEPCDKNNGKCISCQPGWKLPLCQEACDNGTYGNCSSLCGKCVNNEQCDRIGGYCTSCMPGWKMPFCQEACDNGTYGQNCSSICGNCSNGEPCDRFNGTCPFCTPGWQLPLCRKACENGTYGNCSMICGNCMNSEPCDKVRGMCISCMPGWTPPFCQEACGHGTYGQNCSYHCGNCTNGETCNQINGTCLACNTGWQPPLCQRVCDVGFYGDNCQLKCGDGCKNSVCNSVSGLCECLAGWQSPKCQQELYQGTSDQTAKIAGSVVPVLIVLICMGVIIIVIRKRRSKLKSPSLRSNQPSSQNTLINSIYENSNSIDPKGTETNKPVVAVKPQIKQKPTSKPKLLPKDSAHNSLDSDMNRNSSTLRIPQDPEESSADINIYINESVYINLDESRTIWDDVQMELLNKMRTAAMCDEEFEGLPLGFTKAHDAGLSTENTIKNRFMSILPYDETRVVLQGPFEGDSNDYINASYIKNSKLSRGYIAAQGPKRKTVNDFWKMVWQDKVTHIVMLTNVVEGEKAKCEQYWPSVQKETSYGDIHVRGIQEEERANFVIRTFEIKRTMSRYVIQYHYRTWLDHSIPTSTALVDFMKTVQVNHRKEGPTAPLLVHCSAGVGRTGTYIALEIAQDQSQQGTNIAIRDIVEHIREDRCNMIQTKKQYLFLYEAAFEAYTCRNTRLDYNTFDSVFHHNIDPHQANERIDNEFKTLQNMKYLFYKPNHSEAEKEENVNKNRRKDLLPENKHLVYLTTHVPGRNQYINAVFTSTFRRRAGRILTQLPLPETVIDIWRLVLGNDIKTIICLDPDIESASHYWPQTTASTLEIGPFLITLKSKRDVNETMKCYTLSAKQENNSKLCHVSLLHYEGWRSEVPPNTSQMLQLIETMATLQAENCESPILVQCHDGATKCGLFSSACDIISRMKTDHEIDVYMAIRQIQEVTSESVASQVQYRYLYHVAQDYKKQADVYANL